VSVLQKLFFPWLIILNWDSILSPCYKYTYIWKKKNTLLKSVMLQKYCNLSMTKMRYDSILRTCFNQEPSITFYASLPVPRFSESLQLARNLTNVFGRNYTCEQASSRMKQNKPKFHSRTTRIYNVYLHDVMRIGVRERWNQMFIVLRSKDRSAFLIIVMFRFVLVTVGIFECFDPPIIFQWGLPA